MEYRIDIVKKYMMDKRDNNDPFTFDAVSGRRIREKLVRLH